MKSHSAFDVCDHATCVGLCVGCIVEVAYEASQCARCTLYVCKHAGNWCLDVPSLAAQFSELRKVTHGLYIQHLTVHLYKAYE